MIGEHIRFLLRSSDVPKSSMSLIYFHNIATFCIKLQAQKAHKLKLEFELENLLEFRVFESARAITSGKPLCGGLRYSDR